MLDAAACKEYLCGIYTTPKDPVQSSADRGSRPTSTERDAYEPLMDIFTGLVSQVSAALGIDDIERRAKVVNMKDRVMKGSFSQFRPDFVWSWKDEETSQSWTMTAVCGELKKVTAMSSKALTESFSDPICLDNLKKVSPMFNRWLRRASNSQSL